MAFPCIRCAVEVDRRQQALECDVCHRWQHRTCGTGTGILQADYRTACRHGFLDWVCDGCQAPADAVPVIDPVETLPRAQDEVIKTINVEVVNGLNDTYDIIAAVDDIAVDGTFDVVPVVQGLNETYDVIAAADAVLPDVPEVVTEVYVPDVEQGLPEAIVEVAEVFMPFIPRG